MKTGGTRCKLAGVFSQWRLRDVLVLPAVVRDSVYEVLPAGELTEALVSRV